MRYYIYLPVTTHLSHFISCYLYTQHVSATGAIVRYHHKNKQSKLIWRERERERQREGMRPHSFTKDFCLIFLWFFSNILTWNICDYAEVMYNYIKFILNTCRFLFFFWHYNPIPHHSKLYNFSQVGSNISVLASVNQVFLHLSICSLVVL